MKRHHMEIILVALAGLITVGLSIKSIISSNKQQQELNEKQKQLFDAQQLIINKQETLNIMQSSYSRDLQAKSDRIIELQHELRIKSNEQLDVLDHIKNPIPNDVGLSLVSIIQMDDDEIDGLEIGLQQQQFKGNNLLPLETNLQNRGIQKMNLLKDASFSLSVQLISGNKQLTIRYELNPLPLVGFNATGVRGAFHCAMINRAVTFESINVKATLVEANYSSASLADFANCNVQIYYNFSFPKIYGVGNYPTKLYLVQNEKMALSIKDLNLYLNGRVIDIKEIKLLNGNNYSGKCSIVIN